MPLWQPTAGTCVSITPFTASILFVYLLLRKRGPKPLTTVAPCFA